MGLDEQFDAITQKFLSEMAAVHCTPEEYRSWLRAAQDEIATAIDASLPSQGGGG